MNIEKTKYERFIKNKCLKEGIAVRELNKKAGLSKSTIQMQIHRGVIGENTFPKLRTVGIEPTMFRIDSKQLSLEEAEVVTKQNKNERADEASVHLDKEASLLAYEYKELTGKSLTESISRLIKTYYPAMITSCKNNKYAKMSTHELIEDNLAKDRRIKELEKALKDKNGGAK